MRRLLLALIIFLLAAGQLPFAQSLEDVVAIGDLWACTVADFATMAPALSAAAPDDVELPSRIEKALLRYKAEQPLTKGRASLIAAKALKLRSSFFYLLLPVQRYAFRAMVVDGVFAGTSSEGDVMSGVELLDFITMITLKYSVAP
jgi:hypothetical protein